MVRKEGSEQAAGSPGVPPLILASCRALTGLWLAGCFQMGPRLCFMLAEDVSIPRWWRRRSISLWKLNWSAFSSVLTGWYDWGLNKMFAHLQLFEMFWESKQKSKPLSRLSMIHNSIFNNLWECVLFWTAYAFHQQSEKALIRIEVETCVGVCACVHVCVHECSTKMSGGLNRSPGVYLIIS